ncbi:MAG: M23 family metallopeptidase [Myxococcota bacterium]
MIPDSAGVEVKRLRVPRRWVIAALVAVSLLFVFFVAVTIHDVYLVGELKDIRQLRTENVQLRTQIERIDERVAGMTTVVDRVQQFDAQLRKITMLSDPERNLAMGPVGDLRKDASAQDPLAASSAGLKRDLVKNSNDRAVDLIRHRLDVLDAETQSTEQSVRNLQLYLEDQQALLAQTPSLLPARGWKTSEFGFRIDPYTGLRQMHAGVDISSNIGTTIVATGDGQVIWAAPQAAYGNVVMVDHGQGLVSFYAHLSEFTVKVGDQVKRGSEIAKMGNTGRSTGPHCHYEIRLNGVPQDPERYILESF